MEVGYMGIAAVQIDRCDRCLMVWLDTDELQNMVLALARDNYRSARALKKESAETLDLTRGSVLHGRSGRGDIWLSRSTKVGQKQVAVVALQLPPLAFGVDFLLGCLDNSGHDATGSQLFSWVVSLRNCHACPAQRRCQCCSPTASPRPGNTNVFIAGSIPQPRVGFHKGRLS